MNCERYQNELEDFLYGELTEKRAAEIRSHLVGCADCAALRDQLERENDIFAQFYEETAMEPGSEIWNAIHARIATGPAAPVKQKSANWFRGWFRGWFDWPSRPAALRQAAFAVLLIALSVAATTFFLKRGSDKPQDVVGGGKSAASPTQQIVAPTPTPTNLLAEQPPKPVVIPVKPAPPRKLTEQEVINQQIARAEREYQGAIRLLDRAIARRRDSLDPNLIREYESSLALIDDSIAKSRRALREQPNDVTAGQFLLAAYAKKVELMQDIAMQ